MFDIGAIELLVIVIVAVVVIGPKDMPMAMRTAGRWIGKLRKISAHFRSGIDTMVREAELEDMQAEWNRRNAEIMAKHPDAAARQQDDGGSTPPGPQSPAALPPANAGSAESASDQMQPLAAQPSPAPTPAAVSPAPKAKPADAAPVAEPASDPVKD